MVRRHRGGQLRRAQHLVASAARRSGTITRRRSGTRRSCSTYRNERVRPGLDDKVLTEWNGLMLAALAEAAAATGDTAWRDAAVRSAEFLTTQLRRADGRWLRSWQADIGARHLGYAADYAAMIDALVRVYELTGEARWIAIARETADAMIELFRDDVNGGSVHDRHRRRATDHASEGTDGQRSAVGQQLGGHCTAPSRRADRRRSLPPDGRRDLPAARRTRRSPPDGLRTVAVRPRPRRRAASTRSSSPAIEPICSPSFARPTVPTRSWRGASDSIRRLWTDRDDGAAYVCRNFSCQLPASDPDTLRRQLGG